MADITPDDPSYATERPGVSKDDLHKEMLNRHREARDFWSEQFRDAAADMEFGFTDESQWDEWSIETRKGRPMYSVNKVRQALQQITNDQRQNRPQAKVRPAEGGDAKLAEVRQGLIRSIDAQLDAQRAVDTAFQFAVGGGYGVWRITTSYQDDAGFDQIIQREEVANPYSVTFDPAAKKKDRRDARFAFVDSLWSRSAFKARWPKAKLVSVDDCNEETGYWWDDHELTVAEYFYKQAVEAEIVLLSDGSVHDADKLADIMDELTAQGVTVQRRRVIERDKVWHCVVSGAEILEGPNEWAGKYIPLVPVWGDIINLDGQDRFCGAVRFAKDAQRMYNYERSTFIEVLADQPYSPFMAEAKSVLGYEDQYKSMRTRRQPVMFYNGNPNLPNGGRPTREAPPAFPNALATAAQISSDDIKAATGIYDSSLGARSNETSGKAILARERQGDIANFHYMDNLSYAQRYDFEITNDLITKIYDTQRQLRILGEDGKDLVVEVNKTVFDQQTGREIVLNDLTQGRFDVTVTTGPSYSTQRMEAADILEKLSNDPSPLGMVAKYGMIESMDFPGLDTVKRAARMILVQQKLIEPDKDDAPPSPPPPPNPKDVASAENQAAQAALNAAKAEGQEIENQAAAIALGAKMGMTGIPLPAVPPGPMPAQVPPNQGPSGPFSMGGSPPAAPGGFPG